MQKVKLLRPFWLSTGLSMWTVLGQPLTLGLGMEAIATLTLPAPAQAAVLSNWRFDPNARQLEITVPDGVTPRYFLLAQPARIVLDLPNTSVGAVPETQTYAGAVRQIRVGEFQPGLTRIVIELAPDAVLASGQVELRRADGSSGDGSASSRWILRPLLEGDTPSVAAQPRPTPPAPQANPRPTPSPAVPLSTPLPLPLPSPQARPNPPSQTALAPPANTTANLPALEPAVPIEPSTAEPSTAPSPASPPTAQPIPPATSSSERLPPLEPDALEIPIEPPSEPSTDQPVAVSPAPSPQPDASPVREPVQVTQPPAEPEPEPEVRSPQREPLGPVRDPVLVTPPPEVRSPALTTQEPTALPPASQSSDRPTTVQVAPLNPPGITSLPPASIQAAPPTVRPMVPTVTAPPSPVAIQPSAVVTQPPPSVTAQPSFSTTLPPANGATDSTARVTVPPLEPNPVRPTSPLPVQPEPTTQAAVSNPAVLLPSGTVLSLRYPRETTLQLQADSPWQEVLLVSQAVRDRTGAVIVPEGSQVIGRFETNEQGSRFIAQAITVQGRNIQLKAQSDVLMGDRQVSDNELVRNSAIGGAALGVVGVLTGGLGFLVGALAGAAAGAATTYVTAPQPATIQPNQIVEVRLTEDVPRTF